MHHTTVRRRNPSDIRRRHRACICFNAMMASYNRALDCCCKGLQNRLLARCHQLALPAACSPQSGPTKYNKVAEHNKGNIKTKWPNTTKYNKVAEHNKGCATSKSNSLDWDGKQITKDNRTFHVSQSFHVYVAVYHVSTKMPNLMLVNVGHTCCP